MGDRDGNGVGDGCFFFEGSGFAYKQAPYNSLSKAWERGGGYSDPPPIGSGIILIQAYRKGNGRGCGAGT